jgi:hypothetical protein
MSGGLGLAEEHGVGLDQPLLQIQSGSDELEDGQSPRSNKQDGQSSRSNKQGDPSPHGRHEPIQPHGAHGPGWKGAARSVYRMLLSLSLVCVSVQLLVEVAWQWFHGCANMSTATLMSLAIQFSLFLFTSFLSQDHHAPFKKFLTKQHALHDGSNRPVGSEVVLRFVLMALCLLQLSDACMRIYRTIHVWMKQHPQDNFCEDNFIVSQQRSCFTNHDNSTHTVDLTMISRLLSTNRHSLLQRMRMIGIG